jgi:hypothetical protein
MKTVTTISVAILLQFVSFGQIKNYQSGHNRGFKIVSEKTSLTITPVNNTTIGNPKNLFSVSEASVGIATAIIKGTVGIVKSQVKKNAEKYVGEFSCFNSEQCFYAVDASNQVTLSTLPELTISREVILKKNSPTGNIVTKIVLKPELSSDLTEFRYKFDSYKYDYSIAKTKKAFKYLDVLITIKFKAFSLIDGEYKTTDVSTTLAIPGVEANETKVENLSIYSGWIPLPPFQQEEEPLEKVESSTTNPSTDSITTTTKKFDDKGKLISYEKVEVEKSTNPGKQTTQKKVENIKATTKPSCVNYEFEVIVSESNKYKIKAKNMADSVDSNADAISGLLEAILDGLKKGE